MRPPLQGVAPADVPAPEPLTVRLINSVVKKAEVKPKFYETFSGDGYPTEYPYRQKVLLLFQNLDGVDVCLFCMYVQEYGRDCPAPNTNAVYLSYLDSVKYFRPEIPSALGPSVSLRTYVYHQLLIAYLEFVKALGFEQMYIWACPPMQGDDYILYCHPSKQKTPRSDRLRAWYIEMLKLAKDEGIVVHLSTLWDTYFEGGKDHRTDKCSATHIPYLEGDYWPGAGRGGPGLGDSARGGGSWREGEKWREGLGCGGDCSLATTSHAQSTFPPTPAHAHMCAYTCTRAHARTAPQPPRNSTPQARRRTSWPTSWTTSGRPRRRAPRVAAAARVAPRPAARRAAAPRASATAAGRPPRTSRS